MLHDLVRCKLFSGLIFDAHLIACRLVSVFNMFQLHRNPFFFKEVHESKDPACVVVPSTSVLVGAILQQ